MSFHDIRAAFGFMAAPSAVFPRLRSVSLFVTSPQTVTLPVRMYMLATESIDPMMAAVSALIVGLTALVMLLLDRLYGLDKVLVGQKG